MKVFVKSHCNIPTICIDLSGRIEVASVKKAIEQASGVPAEMQCLSLSGKPLLADQPLSLRTGATLQLALPMRGGAPGKDKATGGGKATGKGSARLSRLFVQTLNGRVVPLEVDLASATQDAVLTMVIERVGKANDARLTFGGKPLNPHEPLGKQEIQAESIIQLVGRTNGGRA